MEIKVTKLVNTILHEVGDRHYSCSNADLVHTGRPMTTQSHLENYRTACEDSKDQIPDLFLADGTIHPEERQEIADHFRSMGFSEDVAEYTDDEIGGLIVQSVTLDIQENWIEGSYDFEQGSLFKDDDGDWYFYIGG